MVSELAHRVHERYYRTEVESKERAMTKFYGVRTAQATWCERDGAGCSCGVPLGDHTMTVWHNRPQEALDAWRKVLGRGVKVAVLEIVGRGVTVVSEYELSERVHVAQGLPTLEDRWWWVADRPNHKVREGDVYPIISMAQRPEALESFRVACERWTQIKLSGDVAGAGNMASARQHGELHTEEPRTCPYCAAKPGQQHSMVPSRHAPGGYVHCALNGGGPWPCDSYYRRDDFADICSCGATEQNHAQNRPETMPVGVLTHKVENPPPAACPGCGVPEGRLHVVGCKARERDAVLNGYGCACGHHGPIAELERSGNKCPKCSTPFGTIQSYPTVKDLAAVADMDALIAFVVGPSGGIVREWARSGVRQALRELLMPTAMKGRMWLKHDDEKEWDFYDKVRRWQPGDPAPGISVDKTLEKPCLILAGKNLRAIGRRYALDIGTKRRMELDSWFASHQEAVNAEVVKVEAEAEAHFVATIKRHLEVYLAS